MKNDTKSKLFHTGEFAKKAGVTVRTLRWYDKQGLLTPTDHSEAVQRLYSELDFIKLQQIVTLKFIGMTLKEIKAVLLGDKVDIHSLLEKQRWTLENKLTQLQDVIFAISATEQSLSKYILDAEQFIQVIKSINMSNKFKWFNKFYSDKEKARLAERAKDWTPEDQKKIEGEWNQLFADVRANMDKDLTSPEVQALVDRWQGLVGQFTQGDPGIQSGLNNAYSNIDEAPEGVKEWANSFKDVSEFIQKAMAVRKE